jgi:hypothetical protein
MAYTDTKTEEVIYGLSPGTGGVLSGTGDIAWFASLNVAFRVRRVGVLVVTALTVTSSILSLDYQPTAGSAVGRVTAWAGTMTMTTVLGIQGAVFITPELNLELAPGSRLVVNQTQASTAGAGMITIFGDYRWETVTNFPRVTQLAA